MSSCISNYRNNQPGLAFPERSGQPSDLISKRRHQSMTTGTMDRGTSSENSSLMYSTALATRPGMSSCLSDAREKFLWVTCFLPVRWAEPICLVDQPISCWIPLRTSFSRLGMTLRSILVTDQLPRLDEKD